MNKYSASTQQESTERITDDHIRIMIKNNFPEHWVRDIVKEMLPRCSELQEICRDGYEEYDKRVQKEIETKYQEMFDRAQAAEVSMQESLKDIQGAKDDIQAKVLLDLLKEQSKLAEEQMQAKDELQATLMNMVIQETAKLMEQQKQQFNSQLVTMTKAAAAAAAANTQEIQDNHNKDQPDSQPIR